MKLVINGCYGGFGLSSKAQKMVIGCPHVKLIDPQEYFGSSMNNWKHTMAVEVELRLIHLHKGKIICDNHNSDYEARGCPKLVAAVKKLGKKASDQFSNLKVVEIPDGVEFTIEEYGGFERVAEEHRTW